MNLEASVRKCCLTGQSVLSQLDGLTAPGIVNDLLHILNDDRSHYLRVFVGGRRAMRWVEK
jgi:hypothetical protein